MSGKSVFCEDCGEATAPTNLTRSTQSDLTATVSYYLCDECLLKRTGLVTQK